MKPLTWLSGACLVAVLGFTGTAWAQNSPFKAKITINNRAITYFEIEQRARLNTAVRAPGDPFRAAEDALIDERLQQEAAERFGITVTQEEVEAGVAEFATRFNLEPAQFFEALAQEGVDAETFIDFVRAGVTWRQVLQTRFGPRAQVTDDEVDRAMQLAANAGGARILLSELVLPARTPEERDESMARARALSEELTNSQAFEDAARRLSFAPTNISGGKLDWIPLANLPPAFVNLLLTLKPGETSEPIPSGPGISIYQVRGLQEGAATGAKTVAVDYATILVPGAGTEAARKELARIDAFADTCDDLFGYVKKNGTPNFDRVVQPIGQVPNDIAVELARLDDNEVSTGLVRIADNTSMQVFLMLCGRTTELAEGSREEVRSALVNQRVTSYAASFLEELKADAIIIYDK